MTGRFRLTKSKFQILSIIHFFQLPIFSFFSKFFLSSLIWVSLAGGVFYQDDHRRAQNFTVLPNFDSYFQLGLELGIWHELERAIPKILGFSKFWQVFSAGKSWACFSFKLPKISKFWKSWEFPEKRKEF